MAGFIKTGGSNYSRIKKLIISTDGTESGYKNVKKAWIGTPEGNKVWFVGSVNKESDWKQIQTDVRNGVASSKYNLLDTFTVKKGDIDLTFEIVGFDLAIPTDSTKTHSMTLMLKDMLYCNCPYDAAESKASGATSMSVGYRDKQGSNRYFYSAIHQWLNSNAAAGEWFKLQHDYDKAPKVAATENGFLYDLEQEFQDIIGYTEVTVGVNELDKVSGNIETKSTKFYLPSATEVGETPSNTAVEGVQLPIFSDRNSRKKYVGTKAKIWLLRTPYLKRSTSSSNYSSCYITRVDTTGGVYSNTAASAVNYYCLPLCNII